jgi:hypothetical protein
MFAQFILLCTIIASTGIVHTSQLPAAHIEYRTIRDHNPLLISRSTVVASQAMVNEMFQNLIREFTKGLDANNRAGRLAIVDELSVQNKDIARIIADYILLDIFNDSFTPQWCRQTSIYYGSLQRAVVALIPQDPQRHLKQPDFIPALPPNILGFEPGDSELLHTHWPQAPAMLVEWEKAGFTYEPTPKVNYYDRLVCLKCGSNGAVLFPWAKPSWYHVSTCHHYEKPQLSVTFKNGTHTYISERLALIDAYLLRPSDKDTAPPVWDLFNQCINASNIGSTLLARQQGATAKNAFVWKMPTVEKTSTQVAEESSAHINKKPRISPSSSAAQAAATTALK